MSDELRDTFRRVLRNAYLRASAHQLGGRRLDSLSPTEAHALMEPFEEVLEEDVRFCAEIGEQYRIEGAIAARENEEDELSQMDELILDSDDRPDSP